jgi:hypothetical protein
MPAKHAYSATWGANAAKFHAHFMRASCVLHVRSRAGRDRRLKEEAPLSLELVFFMRAAGAAPRES